MQLEFGCTGEVLVEVDHTRKGRVKVSVDAADMDELMDSVQKADGTADVLERALHDIDGLTDDQIDVCHSLVRDWLCDHHVAKDWMEQLKPVVEMYSDGGGLLDEASVDDLAKIIKAKINLDQGNIDIDTYERILG